MLVHEKGRYCRYLYKVSVPALFRVDELLMSFNKAIRITNVTIARIEMKNIFFLPQKLYILQKYSFYNTTFVHILYYTILLVNLCFQIYSEIFIEAIQIKESPNI